jgi:uncharacterized OB-fold protein
MRSLLRAAAYRPIETVAGRAVAAWDEDVFTLIVNAAERAVAPRVDADATLEIFLAADLPPTRERDLGPAVGVPTTLTRYPATGEGLLGAFEAARTGGSGEVLVLGAEVADARDGASRSETGDGSVAFRFSAAEVSSPDSSGPLGSVRATPSVLDTALAVHGVASDRSRWVGDWGRRAASNASLPSSAGRARGSGTHPDVSEGAYIPTPRYRESLRARWRFAAERCGRCAGITFPPRGRCRSCGSTGPLVPFELPRHDLEVVATTSIGPGGQPTEFDDLVEERGPYEVLIAELASAVRVTLQVADAPAGSLRIGDRVDTRLGRLYRMEGEWRYGRKAIPRRNS